MYCELPFYHFYIDGNWVKPCCYNTEMYQSNSDFNDISLVEFRREMLSGVIPDSCGECKIKEDAGVTSYRQYNQELNPNPIYEHENGVMKTRPYTFDIRLDNICNMKCVMCGPHQSSKWLEDVDVFKEHIDSKISYKQTRTERLENYDAIVDLLKDNATFVSLLGGEPFQMKSVNKILESLTDWNRENTSILITTNAILTYDNKLFEILTGFKKVYFMISIDGFEDVNDYVRYPSRWYEFLKGVDILRNNSLMVKFNLTVSALNLCDIINVEKFANDMNIELILNQLTEPDILHINSLKPSVIDDVDTNDEIKMLLDNYQYDKRNNKRLQRYLHALDIKRNTDSRKVLKWCWT